MTVLDVRTPAPRVPLVVPETAKGSRAWQRRTPLLTVIALLAVVTAAQAIGATRWPGFSDDEGTYVAQAWAARTEGVLSHYTYWYDHPPFGWLQLAALQALFGPLLPGDAMSESRLMVLPYGVAIAGLTGVLARRLGLARPTAVAAVLLMALSPLALAWTRGAYLDVLGLPWLLLAFVLVLSPNRNLWAYAGAGLAFAAAVLSKETLLVALPGLILAAWYGTARRTRAFCLTGMLSVLVLVVLSYPLLAVLKGELLPRANQVSLWDAVLFQLVGRQGTGSALDPDSGSSQLVQSWLEQDPWLLGAGVMLAPIALLSRRLRVPAVMLLILVVVGLRPGYLPQAYVLPLLPFAALVVAGSAEHVIVRARRSVVWALLAVALAGTAVVGVGPAWADGLKEATTSDVNASHREALAAVVDQVSRDERVLIDDSYYVDLVEAGFEPRYGAVWFYKMDQDAGLDPSVVERLPRGWRDLDYVLYSPVMRSALDKDQDALEEVRLAVTNSRVVATFGTDSQRVELREVLTGD